MSEVEFEKFVKPLKKEQQASETMYWGFKQNDRIMSLKNLCL